MHNLNQLNNFTFNLDNQIGIGCPLFVMAQIKLHTTLGFGSEYNTCPKTGFGRKPRHVAVRFTALSHKYITQRISDKFNFY